MQRSSLVTLLTILVLSGICLVLTTIYLLAPGALALPSGVVMTVVSLSFMVIPGVLGVLVWRHELDLDLLDLIPLGFGLTLIGLTALCIVSFEVGLNVRVAGALLLLWSWAMLAVLVLRVRRTRPAVVSADLHVSPLIALALVAIVVASVMTYRIGGFRGDQQPDREEEAQQIGTIEKIATMPRLSATTVMYMRDVATTYYYPTYEFSLGLISAGSSLEPVAVFGKFRGLATAIAILAFYAAAKALFENRRIAQVTLAAAIVMVFSGQASHPPFGYYWGLLAPVGHEADFGLGVTILLEIYFALRFMRKDVAGKFFLVASPLFLIASISLHSREVAQLLSYVGVFPIMLFLFRPGDRSRLLRSVAMVAVIVIVAKGYQTMVNLRVDHIAEIESARRAWELLQLQIVDPKFGLFKVGSIGELVNLLRPVPIFVLLAVPVLLLGFTRQPGILFLCGGVLFWTTVTSFDRLEQYLALFSYSEIIMTPTRYIHHFGYWTLGLVVYGVTWVLSRVRLSSIRTLLDGVRPGRVASAATPAPLLAGWPAGGAFAVALVGGVLVGFQPLFEPRFTGIYQALNNFDSSDNARVVWVVAALAAIGVTAWVLWRRFTGRAWAGWDLSERDWSLPRFGWVYAILPLALLYASSTSPSLLNDLQASQAYADLGSFNEWYDASPVRDSLPTQIRDFLRQQPPGRVVAADSPDELVLTMFTPHYVLNSGTGSVFSTDFKYLDQWDAMQPTHIDYASQIDWSAYSDLTYQPGNSTYQEIVQYERYRVRMLSARDLFTKVRPIFSEDETNDATIRYLNGWNVTFVLVDPAKHTRLKALLDSRPDLYTLAVDAMGRVLYQVRTASSTS